MAKGSILSSGGSSLTGDSSSAEGVDGVTAEGRVDGGTLEGKVEVRGRGVDGVDDRRRAGMAEGR